MLCYQGFQVVLKKHNLEPLAAGHAVCTKRCYEKVLKEAATAAAGDMQVHKRKEEEQVNGIVMEREDQKTSIHLLRS
jgi:hypothetical protein